MIEIGDYIPFIILYSISICAVAYLLGRQRGYDMGWDDGFKHAARKHHDRETRKSYERMGGVREVPDEFSTAAAIIQAKNTPCPPQTSQQ